MCCVTPSIRLDGTAARASHVNLRFHVTGASRGSSPEARSGAAGDAGATGAVALCREARAHSMAITPKAAKPAVKKIDWARRESEGSRRNG